MDLQRPSTEADLYTLTPGNLESPRLEVAKGLGRERMRAATFDREGGRETRRWIGWSRGLRLQRGWHGDANGSAGRGLRLPTEQFHREEGEKGEERKANLTIEKKEK